jgi:hypothetical protein
MNGRTIKNERTLSIWRECRQKSAGHCLNKYSGLAVVQPKTRVAKQHKDGKTIRRSAR